MGAIPVVADALDPDQVAEAVAHAKPDVIVHELTAIGALDTRHFDRDFAATNRLRTEATDHLLSAGHAVGVRRFVAQGISAFGAYARVGGPVKSEDDHSRRRRRARCAKPSQPSVTSRMRSSVRTGPRASSYAAWRFLRSGTSLAPGEGQFELVRKRRLPLVGDGAGVWSFIHIADAAQATAAAVERGTRGAYNVVDDEPAPVAAWLPALAEELGAKRPMHVPRFVGRIFAGEAGARMMTEVRGASNAKAKRELAWTPAHPSWRQGFAAA